MAACFACIQYLQHPPYFVSYEGQRNIDTPFSKLKVSKQSILKRCMRQVQEISYPCSPGAREADVREAGEREREQC